MGVLKDIWRYNSDELIKRREEKENKKKENLIELKLLEEQMKKFEIN
jgi:hypothetical protein